jgi:hypothetical protein
VPRRLADLVDVGRAEALLDAQRPPPGGLLLAEEVGLELVHPGVGQQQGRVVRDERRRRDAGVLALFEERDELLSDRVRVHRRAFRG